MSEKKNTVVQYTKKDVRDLVDLVSTSLRPEKPLMVPINNGGAVVDLEFHSARDGSGTISIIWSLNDGCETGAFYGLTKDDLFAHINTFWELSPPLPEEPSQVLSIENYPALKKK